VSGLAFLVPAFLIGLGALVVPIVVHLRHRQRKTAVPFPSLMFLKRIEFREVRRQQIHHWPLFLLRCLAIMLLVLAFARPFFRDGDVTAGFAVQGGRDVVILLDQSASMGFGDRWSRAQVAAKDIVNELATGDRAAVVLFHSTATVMATPTTDKSLLTATIDEARPTSGSTRYGPALRAAREVVFGTERPGREVIMMSDFQRSGWTGEDLQTLPEGTSFRSVDLSGTTSDITIGSVEVVPANQGERTVGTIVAQVVSSDLAEPRKVRGTLEIAGRPTDAQEITVPVSGPAVLRFAPTTLTGTPLRATIRLETQDSLPGDDTYHFLAFADPAVQVIHRLPLGANPARSFFRQALGISRQPRVEVMVRTSGITAADLSRADVVLLEGVSFPGGAEGQRLIDFVLAGGGLVHILNDQVTGSWPSSLIVAQLGEVVDRSSGEPATIGLIRRDHPVFEPFRLPRSGDFSATRIYRYRTVRSDSMEVLARYDDGAAALLAGVSGLGRVLIWSSSVDNVWSDLPLQPVFLPLAHQLVLYAAGFVDQPTAYRIGDVASFDPEVTANAPVVLVSPGGERRRFDPTATPLSFNVQEQGFYELREARAGGRLLASAAANLALDESNLTPLDPADLAIAAGAPDSLPGADEPSRAEASVQEREREQSLWWYVLALVAIALLVEPLIANRLTGAVRTGAVVSGVTQ